jgi:hypothetical protein
MEEKNSESFPNARIVLGMRMEDRKKSILPESTNYSPSLQQTDEILQQYPKQSIRKTGEKCNFNEKCV